MNRNKNNTKTFPTQNKLYFRFVQHKNLSYILKFGFELCLLKTRSTKRKLVYSLFSSSGRNKTNKKMCFAIYRYKSSATQHKMFFLVFTYPKIIHCFLFFVSYEDMSQAQIRAEGLQKYN